MRKARVVAIGLGALMCTAGTVSAQGGFGGLGDALRKGATDAAKQEADSAVGVPGAVDAAADPKGAARNAADGATREANDRVEGATQDAVGGAAGGARKAVDPY